MSAIFYAASSFSSDLSQWQTDNVTDMGMIFDFSGIDSQALPPWYLRVEADSRATSD
jgi:surface protein